MARDDLVRLRLPAAKKQAWREWANREGLTISAFVERQVDEAIELKRALELQVEDERRRQEARRAVALRDA